MGNFYNENDKKKVAQLNQLMRDGYIAEGDINSESIRSIKQLPEGLQRYHFFAGIGLWDYALDLAGWPEDIPVWTGSCPCQPFSTAGRQDGKEDDRHLWPEWFRLIRQYKPPVIFGEQVASAITKGWLDDVYQGLETEGYAVGSAVLPACSIGAPHRRERLFFVAYREGINGYGRLSSYGQKECEQEGLQSKIRASGSFVGDSKHNGSFAPEIERGCHKTVQYNTERKDSASELTRTSTSRMLPWATGEWKHCPDGNYRLVEPGICLLADGYPSRVPAIHSAGDGIVPQVAAEFIKASLEVKGGHFLQTKP